MVDRIVEHGRALTAVGGRRWRQLNPVLGVRPGRRHGDWNLLLNVARGLIGDGKGRSKRARHGGNSRDGAGGGTNSEPRRQTGRAEMVGGSSAGGRYGSGRIRHVERSQGKLRGGDRQRGRLNRDLKRLIGGRAPTVGEGHRECGGAPNGGRSSRNQAGRTQAQPRGQATRRYAPGIRRHPRRIVDRIGVELYAVVRVHLPIWQGRCVGNQRLRVAVQGERPYAHRDAVVVDRREGHVGRRCRALPYNRVDTQVQSGRESGGLIRERGSAAAGRELHAIVRAHGGVRQRTGGKHDCAIGLHLEGQEGTLPLRVLYVHAEPDGLVRTEADRAVGNRPRAGIQTKTDGGKTGGIPGGREGVRCDSAGRHDGIGI